MIDDIRNFQSDLLNETYFVAHHSSGVPIYVFPKKLTVTYALFAVDFGSVDRMAEGEKFPAGIAHFLEHKLFENEDGTDSFERFSELGADANAYTASTRTVYLFSATDRFEEAFRELLTFVTHPAFMEDSVAKERGIISEEICQTGDNPYNRAYYNMLRGLYRNHPIKEEICGTLTSIEKITPEILYRAYHAFYHLSNSVLIVCGDVTPEDVFHIAEEILPDIPPAGKTIRQPVEEEPFAVCPRTETRGQVAKPVFCIGVKDTEIHISPEERIRKDAGMAILCEMLFSPSGELYNRLFREGKISADLSAEYTITDSFAFLRITGETDDPDEVFREICSYIEEKRLTGLSEKDFERCLRVEYAEYIKSFDSSEEIAENLLSFVLDGADLFEYAKIVRETEFSYIEHLLQTRFEPAYFTLSAVYPEEEESEGET